MARKNQKLINYHGNGYLAQASASTLELGEIAVKHGGNTAGVEVALGIKDGHGDLRWFIDSAATKSAIDGVNSGLNTKIDTLSGVVKTFSASVVTTYATSANTVEAINKVDAKVEGLKINDKKITSATTLNAAEIKLSNAYAGTNVSDAQKTDWPKTGETVETAIDKLSDLINAANTAHTSLETTFNTFSANTTTNVANLSAGTIHDIQELSGAILTKIGTAYVYKGTIASNQTVTAGANGRVSALPGVDNPTVGDVYNVAGEVTVAADGKPMSGTSLPDKVYPAGTNFAWNGSEWDALGGVVDLSGYLETAAFNYWVTNTYTQKMSSIDGKISALETWSGATDAKINAISAATMPMLTAVTVDNKSTDYLYTNTKITGNNYQKVVTLTLSANVVTSLTAATETAGRLADAKIVKELSGNTKAAIDGLNSSNQATQKELDVLEEKLGYSDSAFTYANNTLSGELKAVSGKTATALQAISGRGDDYITVTVENVTGNAFEKKQALGIAADVKKTVAEVAAVTSTGSLIDAKAVLEISGNIKTTIEQAQTALDGKFDTLSGKTFGGSNGTYTSTDSLAKQFEAVSAVTYTALQDVDVLSASTYGITATKVTTDDAGDTTTLVPHVHLDFSNMIVDCGFWD